MDTTMQVRPSEKKVLLGEVRLLPVDTIVEPRLYISSEPFLRGPKSQGNWYFNVGFELRLLHQNFEAGARKFSGGLLSVGPSGFGEAEGRFLEFVPVQGSPMMSQMAAVRQAIEEMRLSFEEFVVDEYVRGDVSFQRLGAFFVKRYRNPFGPAPCKRSRS